MTQAALRWGLAPVQPATGSPAWVRRALIAVTLTLVLFGLISVYSASSFAAREAGLPDSHFVVSQIARALVGAASMLLASFVDYRLYRKLAWPIIGIVTVTLLVVILPWTTEIAPARNGARRWIALGPLSFQPSELAKVGVVIWTAALAAKKRDVLTSFREGLLPFLLVLGPVLALIVLEPHLSATLITTLLIALVLYSAGVRLRHFLMLAGLGLPILAVLVKSNPYQLRRLFAFVFPEADPTGVGYQLEQARIAIGAGGLFGVGFAESSQKLQFLPETQNDFIFPIIAEEWGFLGAALVLGAFLMWTMLGFRIAAAAPDMFGRLLAIGLTGIVAIGAFGHMGVTMGVLPTTGVSLPFISAGGTGIVVALGVTGILVNIASRRRC